MIDIDEPLSWLTLERYSLGELPPEERARIERRLLLSPADRACLEQIRGDLSELPPLPIPLHGTRARRLPRAALLSTALAAAAAMIALLRTPEVDIPSQRTLDGVKGSQVAIALYSDRGGEHPREYSAGERFKVFATCPPELTKPMQVVVFQARQSFTPLGPARVLACGNRVPLPGAFSLDGDEAAHVCLTWAAADARTPQELGEEAVCLELHPR